MLEFKNVIKSYKIKKNTTFKALDDLSFKVNENDIFGIIGLSGAGKSTILRLISGLDSPNSGEVIVNNISINSLSNKNKREYYKNVGVVFQGYNLLYQKNIFDNIALPLKFNKYNKDEINFKVNKLLDLVGLKDKALSYPSMLSGGQRQRVSIARALVLNPKILLLDEVTSALDPKTTIEILKLLKEIHIKQNLTIIMITHEISVASLLTNRLIVLNDGKIVESGNTTDVLNNPKEEITKLLLGRKDGHNEIIWNF